MRTFQEVVQEHVARLVADHAQEVEEVLVECIALADFDQIDRLRVVEYPSTELGWWWGVASML